MTGNSFSHAKRGRMTPQCAADGCARNATASTPAGHLCSTHSSRWYRHGKLEIDNPRLPLTTPEQGARFGSWTVVGESEHKRHAGGTTRIMLCVCVCGVYKAVQLRNLLNGSSTSCGCNKPKKSAQDRFWAKVKKSGDNDCWPYGESTHYGKVRTGGRGAPQMAAHRYSYMISFGVVPPPDMVVMHKCDNPKCVNPRHLCLGTTADNAADMVAKGRHRGGFKKGYDPKRKNWHAT